MKKYMRVALSSKRRKKGVIADEGSSKALSQSPLKNDALADYLMVCLRHGLNSDGKKQYNYIELWICIVGT